MSISVAGFLTRLLNENGPTGALMAAEPPPPSPKGRRAARRERLTPSRLLYVLWDAGYRLQLVQSDTSPVGYTIIPIGAITPSPELLDLYETHHDDAVQEVVEACRVGKIDPLLWHEVASTTVAKSGEAQS